MFAGAETIDHEYRKSGSGKGGTCFHDVWCGGKQNCGQYNKKPAPALIPRRPASDRGFLVIPCITAPERAKAIPVSPAASALGIRIST